MMRTQHRKTLWEVLFILFAVVCLFFVRPRDKSVDHYNRGTNQNIRNIRYACIGNRLLK
jgi:hypothetical protein